MPMDTMQDLLKHELGDLYFAEKQILKDMKRMIREASDPEMRQRLQQHQEETEEQVRNLEQAFESVGLKPKAEKCPGILGISQEKKDFDEEEPSKPILEAFNLGAGLRVEHYEIAGYRSAISLAKSMGQRQCVELLKRNLEQELAMAKFIEQAAQKTLRETNEMLSMEEEGEESEEEEESGNGRAARGGARKKSGGRMAKGAPGANSRARERRG